GSFRVEEFRLPVLEGRIAPVEKKPLVRAASLPAQVQINYVAGGGAANLPVRVSAMVRARALNYSDHEAFSFNPPRKRGPASTGDDDEEASASEEVRVIADKLPLTLSRDGAGRVTIPGIPASPQPQELVL